MWTAWADKDEQVALAMASEGHLEAVMPTLALAELHSLHRRGRLGADELRRLEAAGRPEPATLEDCVSGGRLHGHLRRDPGSKASLVDCIIYAVSRRLGAKLWTRDADLEGLPGVEVLGKKA